MSPLLASLYLYWSDALFHDRKERAGEMPSWRYADMKVDSRTNHLLWNRSWRVKFGLTIDREDTRVVGARQESPDLPGYSFDMTEL